ncbi:MAG: S9 family peptidase [Chloroflexi bacterium]|nr:S9 family peptidase [Chloroflexota bacterium]
MPRPELKLESLVASGAITGLDVSPDGRFITFGSTAGGVSQVYVQSLEGGEPAQITHGTESATQPKWSPAGDLIAYLQDVGGDENYQVYVVSPEGGEARDVSGAPGKLHENFSWSPDGARIAYVSNRDGQFDVYYSDVASGQVTRVTNHPSVHHAPEFSPDGTQIAFASNRSEYVSNWDTFVVSLLDGRERKVTRHEGEADEMSYYAGQQLRWSPDGRRILVASSVPGNYDVMAVDVETLEREWIATSTWDEGNAQWSPDGSHVAYVVNDDGNFVIHVKNLADGRLWPVSQPGGVSGYIGMRGKGGDYRWTPDGRSIVYSYLGPREAGSIWIVDAMGGEPRRVYSTLPPDIDRQLLVRPSLVHYTSFDGRQNSAFLWQPEDRAEKVPAVVMPHGGPTGQTLNSFNPTVQYLVNRGYAVLAPNFRGSTGYGREFQWLNRNDWGGGDLKDVVAAADWLREHGIADRVGIYGGSYGGYMTMMAITKHPDRWAAAVAIFPMVDLVTSYTAARPDMKQFQVRNIGTPEENPDLYYDRSPINFVENIQCPVLVLQGERDARCRLDEVQSMCRRLESTGRQFELVVYEHEGHGFLRKENRLDSVRRTVDFFDRHLARTEAHVSG